MRKMRQKTPDACGETPTLSETNVAPVAFSLNQNSAVCLPLVSDGQKLIWVHSNQINLQMDGAAELDKAFDKFPYLTQKQTAALAQRCSLHPDQVKVWFMVQRLRYGISWDYKDIHKVRRKLKLSRGKEWLQSGTGIKEDRGEKKKWKKEVKESDGKKAEEVREDQSASEGRMMGENVRAYERLERKMEQEQPMKKEKDRKVEEVEEDKKNIQKKRKRVTVADKLGKKRMKQGDEGVVERAGDAEIRSDEAEKEWQKSTQTETKKKKANKRLLSVQEWPSHKSFVVPDEPLDASPASDVPPLTDNQTPNICVTPVKSGSEGKTEMEAKLEGEPKELTDVNDDPVVAEGSPTSTQQRGSSVADARTPRTRIRWSKKTRSQLAMMKVAFSHCQYPDSGDYNQLATLIGVPRYVLVQWFGDMRYYVKKARPRWMNQEQHRQALANIKYQQCLNALSKAQPGEGGGKASWKMKLERSESNGEDESVQVPPEEK